MSFKELQDLLTRLDMRDGKVDILALDRAVPAVRIGQPWIDSEDLSKSPKRRAKPSKIIPNPCKIH